MKEKRFQVNIFDGTNTWVWHTTAEDIFKAENKVVKYHTALGRTIVKVSTVEVRY